MRHRRLRLQRFWIGDAEVAVGVADLVVVAHPGSDALDWELVVRCDEELLLAPEVYDLAGETAEGRRVRGAAVLVRRVGPVLVFRGGGPLDGIRPDELR